MAKKRRVARSLLGIPIWLITGLSLFLIISIIYDIFVGDRNAIRYMLLGLSILILLISIFINLVPLKTIVKVARRQMGG